MGDKFPVRWQCFLAVLCSIHALAHLVSDTYCRAYDANGTPLGVAVGEEIPAPAYCLPVPN